MTLLTEKEFHKLLKAQLLTAAEMANEQEEDILTFIAPMLGQLVAAVATALVAVAADDDHLEDLLISAHENLDELVAKTSKHRRKFEEEYKKH